MFLSIFLLLEKCVSYTLKIRVVCPLTEGFLNQGLESTSLFLEFMIFFLFRSYFCLKLSYLKPLNILYNYISRKWWRLFFRMKKDKKKNRKRNKKDNVLLTRQHRIRRRQRQTTLVIHRRPFLISQLQWYLIFKVSLLNSTHFVCYFNSCWNFRN